MLGIASYSRGPLARTPTKRTMPADRTCTERSQSSFVIIRFELQVVGVQEPTPLQVTQHAFFEMSEDLEKFIGTRCGDLVQDGKILRAR